MDNLLTMSEKEINRLKIMGMLEKKQITQMKAAEQLDLSIRQVKRIWRAYRSLYLWYS